MLYNVCFYSIWYIPAVNYPEKVRSLNWSLLAFPSCLKEKIATLARVSIKRPGWAIAWLDFYQTPAIVSEGVFSEVASFCQKLCFGGKLSLTTRQYSGYFVCYEACLPPLLQIDVCIWCIWSPAGEGFFQGTRAPQGLQRESLKLESYVGSDRLKMIEIYSTYTYRSIADTGGANSRSNMCFCHAYMLCKYLALFFPQQECLAHAGKVGIGAKHVYIQRIKSQWSCL